MAFLTSGGSAVTSSNIVDGEIVNDDINPAAAIAQSKIAGASGSNSDLFVIEQTNGTTHSLTTLANQRVLVIVSGDATTAGATHTIDVQYNGVSKSQVTIDVGSGSTSGWCTTYTEVPGAATHDITISTGASLGNVKILVIKFKSS